MTSFPCLVYGKGTGPPSSWTTPLHSKGTTADATNKDIILHYLSDKSTSAAPTPRLKRTQKATPSQVNISSQTTQDTSITQLSNLQAEITKVNKEILAFKQATKNS